MTPFVGTDRHTFDVRSGGVARAAARSRRFWRRGRRFFPVGLAGACCVLIAAPIPSASTARAAGSVAQAGSTAPSSAPLPAGSFSFGAAGDMGARPDAGATLDAIGRSGVNFFLHTGDLSYDQIKPESAWCAFAQSHLQSSMPYEIVSGEHDGGGLYSGPNQLIGDFAACMPDRLGSTGTYGTQYFFDYPAAAPMARVIMITPGLSIYAPKQFPSYGKGSAADQWVADAIDGARAAGTPWVIVGMAFDCITAGEKTCEVGQDLFDLLVAKKVDLILQGHEHGYERSRPLALGPKCVTMTVGFYNAACVAGSGTPSQYVKDAGTVVVVAGTAGITLRPMNPKDSEAPYFSTLMGSNIHPGKGFVRYTVSPTRIDAAFVPSVKTSFTDSFSIAVPGAPPTASPTTPPTPAVPLPISVEDPAGAGADPPTPCPPAAPVQPTASPPAADTTAGDATTPVCDGYWMLDRAGRVYPFGDASPLGDLGTAAGASPDAVGLVSTPAGDGYWILDSTGAIHPFGGARSFGQIEPGRLAPGETITSLSATPTGNGYWVFTNHGRVFAFGDAPFLGDMSATKLNGPVLGSVATPSGQGYYLVAADGGIFAFGDARFAASMGGQRLNAPVRSLVPASDGHGYWLVASDGGIFAFDAPFRGSMGATKLNQPIVGMVRYGNGYIMVAADGGIFDFSDKAFQGSLGGQPPPNPIVSIAPLG
jgi:hypothetical protein